MVALLGRFRILALFIQPASSLGPEIELFSERDNYL